MKMFIYSYRSFDEAVYFQGLAKKYGVEIGFCPDKPTQENAHLAEGYDYLSIITTPIDAQLVERFHNMGIKMISTRTIGYDHIDLAAAKKVGMRVSNATYSPYCVADYALMLMLMSLRKMKYIMNKAALQDYTLPGNIGRELPRMTVGVIGTGRIGEALIGYLHGMGCKVLCYDIYEKESLKEKAAYVSLDEIYASCDVISLHIPLTEDNFHMLDDAAFEKMKDRVVIVNTARGGLIDSKALIRAIESGKVGAAGLDVVENEFNMYYYDKKTEIMDNHELSILRAFPNVVVTPHMAFYSEDAVRDMVDSSFKACIADFNGDPNPFEVIL